LEIKTIVSSASQAAAHLLYSRSHSYSYHHPRPDRAIYRLSPINWPHKWHNREYCGRFSIEQWFGYCSCRPQSPLWALRIGGSGDPGIRVLGSVRSCDSVRFRGVDMPGSMNRWASRSFCAARSQNYKLRIIKSWERLQFAIK